MREQGASPWARLQEGAYFYACGDATRMARDADAALVGIAQQHGSLSPAAARAFIDQLGRENAMSATCVPKRARRPRQGPACRPLP